jgi:CHAT domain-containing protein
MLTEEISKDPNQRNPGKEQQIRDRLKSIAAEGKEIWVSLNRNFPDFAALSKPVPISVRDTQSLLGDDEALVVFDFDEQSYAWVVTRTNADWVRLKLTEKSLSDQVERLRSSLTFNLDKPFDTQLAFQIYLQTVGVIADELQGKTHLSVVTNGALTSLPLQLLVTREPSGKRLKEVDWLVRSYAITNLPSVASLKTLRLTSFRSTAMKSMILSLILSFLKTKAIK